MTNKAATEKKTQVWCEQCRSPCSVRHARNKEVLYCPSCGKEAVVESIQVVMPQ